MEPAVHMHERTAGHIRVIIKRKKSTLPPPNFYENLIFLLQLQNRLYDLLQFFKTGQLSSLTGFEAEVIMVLIFFFGFFICENLEVTKYKKL